MTKEVLNGYICFWKGQKVEVYADTTYNARNVAHNLFKEKAGRKKVNSYDITVMLAEKDGKQVTHIADF